MRSSALSAMRSSEDIVFRKRHVHLVSEHLKAYAVTDATPAPIDAAASDRARARGRGPGQAPEIDGAVILRGEAPAGEFVRARIDRATTYDLHGMVTAINNCN